MKTLLLVLMCCSGSVFATGHMRAASFMELPGDLTEVTFYYPNGNILQKGYMIDGLKTGVWLTYSLEGEVTAKARYDRGEKCGIWKIYDENGNVEYKICYRGNEKMWARQFDDEGNMTAFSYK